MKHCGFLALATATLLIGCGGNNSSVVHGGSDNRSEVQRAASLGLKLMASNGDIDLGLATRGTVGAGGWTQVTFDSKRALWNRQLTTEDSPEGPDGSSSDFRSITKVEYFSDEAMTIPAGKSTRHFEQVPFNDTETWTVTENIKKGPLAGFNYTKTAVTNLGTGEVQLNMDATDPTLGKVHTVSPFRASRPPSPRVARRIVTW